MRPRRTAVTAAVCAVLVGGCASAGGGTDGGEPQPTAATSPAPTGPDGPASPSPSPDRPSGSGPDAATSLLAVSGRSLDGGEIDLGTFAGEHLVLWMWAPW